MPVKSYSVTMCGNRPLVAKTCRSCNELKMASEFNRYLRKGQVLEYYDSECRHCGYLRSNECLKRANDESLEKATRYRDNWTKDELATLQRLEGLDLSHREIAERLGRTISAVFNRLHRLRRDGESCVAGVRLCYYDASADKVFRVGQTYVMTRKGSVHRLNKAAQELVELHTQLIFFIEVDEGGEYMGIRGLDSLRQGDDREPKDTSEDLEVLDTDGNDS